MVRTHALIPVLLLGSSATVWAKPPADADAPSALIELRAELFEAGEDGAKQDVPRFRALCDTDGFPLVGNAVRKTGMYQPSSYCAMVRERQQKA
ncbi:MAG TPA: hypothetical protein VG755_07535 [Nannocystaceae bacterium]|nr:hypothetical protein [Nannocystaceae bacterium]